MKTDSIAIELQLKIADLEMPEDNILPLVSPTKMVLEIFLREYIL